MQKLSEDPLTACVECGAPVRKVMQPVSIAFKGSGFYSTDYKSGTSQKTETTKNGDSGKKEGSSEKKSTSTEKSTGKQD
jgi:predicted nucleic acid-binding Zn ribbon protein